MRWSGLVWSGLELGYFFCMWAFFDITFNFALSIFFIFGLTLETAYIPVFFYLIFFIYMENVLSVVI